ncbi:Uncharacterised protein [[Clostridium] sordellii]|uniref:hypothetical protein n=1 Tax=Paraclostridium sordellii TaxID=1505 RepID=UPI0005E61FF9|nr:hypothetical protein [Paeniclostridium sordellii]CEP50301.1 Uncharacterised protein [[Clostridium] sordellii] [Paeniclostridium sordellii]CEQ12722.1 Uncharacterised protein [[Clostridium] sordellii] [Paeniclostridium sordellii]
MIIKIYVRNKLEHVGVNEFVAMNNYYTYCQLYGKANVEVERSPNQSLESALKELKK